MILQENEIVMLTLGCALYFFIIGYRKYIEHIPHLRIFLFSFRVLLVAWISTVLEGFFLTDMFNVLEHLCYTCSSAALVLWLYKVARTDSRKGTGC